jgi:CHAT domain-containing protein
VGGVDALEYTQLESGELARLFPDCRLLEGAEASEAALRADNQPRRFRHFACHALHDPRSPAESALLLSAGGGENGRVSAPEIASLNLPAGLSMLSACETALGRRGDEASAGLPRAFLAAGSRGVVASLWKVDDLSTAVLVKHLYRGLERGLPADRALQEAQEAVRRWVHPHPAYWAAFCLTGQPQPEPGLSRDR